MSEDLTIKIKADSQSAEADIKRVGTEFQTLVDVLNEPLTGIEYFRQLKKTVSETEAQFTAAQQEVAKLAREISQTENPSRGLQKSFEQAKASAKDWKEALTIQQTELHRVRQGLREAGIDTTNLAQEQIRLKRAMADAEAAAREESEQLKAARDQAVSMGGAAQKAAEAMVAQHRAAAEVKTTLAAVNAEITTTGKASPASMVALERALDAEAHAARQAKSAFSQLKGQIKEAGQESQEAARHSHGLADSWEAVAVAWRAAGIAAIVAGVSKAGKASLDASMQAERLSSALKAITGSDASAAKEMEFLRSEAKRLGLGLYDLGEAYKGVAASSKGTVLEGEATRQIFSAIAESGAALRLSGEDVQGILLAVSQMLSKGTVSAEELRGQVGERLPGAFSLAAEAMGVSTAELDKMLESGQILATDLLPKLAQKLHAKYGDSVGDAAHSTQGEINHLKNALSQLGEEMANESGLGTGFKNVVGWLAQAIEKTIEWKNELKKESKDKPIFSPVWEPDTYKKEMSDLLAAWDDFWTEWGFIEKKHAEGATPKPIEPVDVEKIRLQQKSIQESHAAIQGENARLAEVRADREKAVKEVLEQSTKVQSGLNDALSDYSQRLTKGQIDVSQYGRLAQQALQENLSAATEVFQYSAVGLAEWANKAKAAYADQAESARRYYENLKSQAAAAGEAPSEALSAQLERARQNFESMQNMAAGYSLQIDSTAKGMAQNVLQNINGMIEGIDFSKLQQGQASIEPIIQSIQGLRSEGVLTSQTIDMQLTSAFQRMSAVDLQTLMQQVYSLGQQGQDVAQIMQSGVNATLHKLGVDSEKFTSEMTKAGSEAIQTFSILAQYSDNSSNRIQTAFDAALASATNLKDIDSLLPILQRLGQEGKVPIDWLADAIQRVNERSQELKVELDPVEQAFRELGIESSKAMQAAADAAKKNLDIISAAYKRQERTLEDVNNAQKAYAEKARAAAQAQGEAQLRATEAVLGTQRATLGLTDELEEAGREGQAAGQKIASGMADASAAARDAAQAATEAGEKAAEGGESESGYSYERDAQGNLVKTNKKGPQMSRVFKSAIANWEYMADELRATVKSAYEGEGLKVGAMSEYVDHINRSLKTAQKRVKVARRNLESFEKGIETFGMGEGLAVGVDAFIRSAGKVLSEDQLSNLKGALESYRSEAEQKKESGRETGRPSVPGRPEGKATTVIDRSAEALEEITQGSTSEPPMSQPAVRPAAPIITPAPPLPSGPVADRAIADTLNRMVSLLSPLPQMAEDLSDIARLAGRVSDFPRGAEDITDSVLRSLSSAATRG